VDRAPIRGSFITTSGWRQLRTGQRDSAPSNLGVGPSDRRTSPGVQEARSTLATLKDLIPRQPVNKMRHDTFMPSSVTARHLFP